jgi:hypothetical protein
MVKIKENLIYLQVWSQINRRCNAIQYLEIECALWSYTSDESV